MRKRGIQIITRLDKEENERFNERIKKLFSIRFHRVPITLNETVFIKQLLKA